MTQNGTHINSEKGFKQLLVVVKFFEIFLLFCSTLALKG